MPTYEYRCPTCGKEHMMVVKIDERGGQKCDCGTLLERIVSVPAQAQFRGRVVKGGGPDRFTADVMGIPLKDLPSGLRTQREQ